MWPVVVVKIYSRFNKYLCMKFGLEAIAQAIRERYGDGPLFPEKVARAKESIRKYGLPDFNGSNAEKK